MDIVRLLLLSGADTNRVCHLHGYTPLGQASAGGHEVIVNLLLVAKADAEKACGPAGQLPLDAACSRGHLEIAQLLLAELQAKARQDAPFQPQLQTSLVEACGAGHLAIVQLLLDSRADIDGCCKSGHVPLGRASYNGQMEVARLLLQRGAEKNVVSRLDGH